MRTVSLANQTKTIQVFNLPSVLVPEMSTLGSVGTTEHSTALARTKGRKVRGGDGERRVRLHRKRISGSVTLMPKGQPGDIVHDLPESVLAAPDVARALGAFPPKIAAKTFDKEEREKRRADAAAKADAAKAEAEKTTDLLRERAETKAKNAGADVDAAKEAAKVRAKTKRDADESQE